MYKTIRLPLKLSDSTKSKLLDYRYQQNYFYNIGVELAIKAITDGEPIPSNWTANKHLKEMTTEEWHPPVVFQRAACHQGLEALRKHRSRRGTLETSIYHLKEKLKKAIETNNKKNVEKYTKQLAINEDKLKRLLDKGMHRFYRTRKAQDNSRSRAVVLEEQVRLINQDKNGAYWDVKLVGGCELRLAKPIKIEDGWEVVGSAQIVESTKKITSKTQPKHRQYQINLQLKKDDPPIVMPTSEEEMIGVDIGVAISMAASDGRNFYAANVDDIEKEIVSIQQKMSRCNKGSRQWKKYRRKLKQLHRKKTNKKDDTDNQNIARLLDPREPHLSAPKAVAMENLKPKNMKTSAKGTIEHPGKNVAQKRGLNRSLHGARPGALLRKTEAASIKRGVVFIKVSPAGTSQHCHGCRRKGIRESQAVFRCAVCGVFNADWNAACNICKRGWEKCGGGSRTAVSDDRETDQASGVHKDKSCARQKTTLVDSGIETVNSCI